MVLVVIFPSIVPRERAVLGVGRICIECIGIECFGTGIGCIGIRFFFSHGLVPSIMLAAVTAAIAAT